MVTIPTAFPAQPLAVATFNFEDIVTGLGTVIFFGIASEDSSAVDYHLITNKEVFSQPVGTRRSSQGTTTIDFDTSAFNLTRTAKGTAYFSAAMGCSDGQQVRLLVQLKHVDSGLTETNITSEVTSQTYTATTGVLSNMVFLELPITEKHFKKGDFLRLTIKLNQVNASGSSDLGHDPKNQNFNFLVPGTKDTTVMTLLMSFRVDV